jgi:hypothetical protein
MFFFDCVSMAAGQPAQRVPHVCGRVARREQGVAAGRRSGGLGQVPQVGDPLGVLPGRRFGLVVLFAGELGTARRGDGEDRDPVLALADLPSGRGPLPVAAELGGAGPLGVDEQDVSPVLAG